MIPPQIEIIHCLQEEDMADRKKEKGKRDEDTTPVERCPVPDATTSDSGGHAPPPPPPPTKPEPIG